MADTPFDWQSNPFTAFLQSAGGDAWREAMVRQSARFWEAQKRMLDEYEELSRTLLARRRAATEAALETMRKFGDCRDNADWSKCCNDWLAGSFGRMAADSRDLLEQGMKSMSDLAATMSADMSGAPQPAQKDAATREATTARGAAIAQTAAAMQEAAARSGKAPLRFKKGEESESPAAGPAVSGPLGAGSAT